MTFFRKTVLVFFLLKPESHSLYWLFPFAPIDYVDTLVFHDFSKKKNKVRFKMVRIITDQSCLLYINICFNFTNRFSEENWWHRRSVRYMLCRLYFWLRVFCAVPLIRFTSSHAGIMQISWCLDRRIYSWTVFGVL